jgi:hypothetical protein
MNDQEDDSEHQKKMDERGSHMEHYKRSDPCEEQKKR